MNHQYVLLESRGGIATVTLNDPGKLNPLSIPLQSEFAQVQIRSDDSVSAVILTGAGKAFCVGADLNSLDPAKMAAEGKSTGFPMVDFNQEARKRCRHRHSKLPGPVSNPNWTADGMAWRDAPQFRLPFPEARPRRHRDRRRARYRPTRGDCERPESWCLAAI